MKIRTGFVSNSSSSSYVCNVCKYTYSGFDAEMSEGGMFECIKGHIICEGHMSSIEDPKEAEQFEVDKEECDWPYDVPVKYCPVCNMKKITDLDMLEYCLKILESDNVKMSDKIRKHFKSSFEDFQSFIVVKK